MSNIKLDKNTLEYFGGLGSERIKVFLYTAWCSGNKIDIVAEFELDESVEFLEEQNNIKIYIDKRDKENLVWSSITRVAIADHTGIEKVRYIYKWAEVKWRCGCGSSFNFGEEKSVKLDLGKLKDMKAKFWK